MKQYLCLKCGWIYDEAVGDPDNGIAPGTKWAELPDTYQCHDCEVVKGDSDMWQEL